MYDTLKYTVYVQFIPYFSLILQSDWLVAGAWFYILPREHLLHHREYLLHLQVKNGPDHSM